MRCWVGKDQEGSAVRKHKSVYRGVCCGYSWRIKVVRSMFKKHLCSAYSSRSRVPGRGHAVGWPQLSSSSSSSSEPWSLHSSMA